MAGRLGGEGGLDSFWSRRMLEWTVVGAVVLAVVLLLVRQANVVKGQAELAAIRSTLAALRTALVIDHLQRTARTEETDSVHVQRNPFELLQNRMPNYVGMLSAREVESLPAGAWMYAPECACLAYRPMDMEWFFSPDGSGVAWFHVSSPPGLMQISARVAYQWQKTLLE